MEDKVTYLWDNKHGEQMNYTITNSKRFAKVQSVDIHRDNILITLKGGGFVESWGEHGANDFAEFGITLH